MKFCYPCIALEGNSIRLKGRKPLTLKKIATTICAYYHIDIRRIKSVSQKAKYVLLRQISTYIARFYTHYTFKSIGEFFNRKYSSIMHNANQITKRLKEDNNLRQDIKNIEVLLNLNLQK